MFRFVVILALLGVVLGANVPAVPTTEWNGRIVGGQIAGADQFPYQVSLRTPANFHFCGGSCITDRWVLSAAHCTIGRAPSAVDAIVGTLSRIAGGIRYPIIRIINHEHYNANWISNDVCILQTESEILPTSMVGFIALGQGIIGGNLQAVISGWGQTANPGAAAATLMFLLKTTITNEVCRASHTTNNAQFVFESTLCAGGTSGQGICMGDSGGPLVVNNAVHGIASWVIPCGVGFPDAYARVGYFHPWITQNMNS